MSLFNKIFLLFLIIFNLSCSKKKETQASKGIYYWRQELNLSTWENNFIAKNNINILYIKFFDLDIRGDSSNVIPIAVLMVNKALPTIITEIIPVVFITNRSLLNKTEIEIDSLAFKLVKKVVSTSTKNNLPFKQLQIDCDWSQKTKENYFLLLKKIKQYSSKTISCTIRLHQIKYYKNTGIPPVERGMLMYYNMGELKKINETNSIHNYETGKSYTQKLKEYPLKLDVVFPAFSWAVKYKNNSFTGIWNEASQAQLNDTSLFEKLENNSYRVRYNIENNYLYKDDIVRWENSEMNSVLKSCNWIKSKINTDSFSLSIFHLKEEKLKEYDEKELVNIYNSFK